MEEIYEKNIVENRPWKKVLCVLLSVIMAFGTFITHTVGSSRLHDWLGIKSMLSTYAAEIVDTKGAIAVDEEAMLADVHTINLENKDGSNTVYLFSEPISYTDENGNIKTKDISVEKQSDQSLKKVGYEYANGQNDYRINFSKDQNKGVLVQFDDCTYSIVPKSVIRAEGNEAVAEYLNENFEVFQYKNIYGNGTNLRFYPQLNGVKDEIVLNQNINQNEFSFELKTENCKAVLNDDATVSLVSDKDESVVQTFSAPYAYDSEYVEGDRNEHYIDCSYSLDKIDDNTYIMSVNIDSSWLESKNTVYPITIDPTTSNISMSADTSIYEKMGTNNYGNEQTCCFGYASDYGMGRVYMKFTMPTAIKKGATINSAYNWLRETTGRTTTTYIKPFLVTSSWSETGVYWTNRPSHTLSVVGTRKNINGSSTDDPDNSFWFKFDIKDAVKKWADGTANYGVTYISEEEQNKAYNWRAFASRTYSTSSMRPYTVINYTNDATAPTVTSVTGNPTAWTKNNVTLTVNGAADNSGGAGLHSTPYSFSTTKGSYTWQSGNTKTFSSNCTVYVYVRDALDNIRLVSTQTISKIDKTAPTYASVTGNPTSWTNNDVTLTINGAADEASGLNSTAYSFSTVSDSYSWQSSKTKAISSNGTYYVYIRDAVGNIKSAGSVSVTKIDKTKPVISDVDVSENADTGKITVTITATDSGSGIEGYSFDGGITWQTDKSKTLDSVPNTLSIAVKDNAGNIATQITENLLPEFYEDGGLVGILNLNTDSNESIQYKIGEDGEWVDYLVPFAIPLYEESTVYAKVGNSAVISKTITPDASSIGAYTESNTDFTLSYKNVSFDFIRTYNSNDKKWFFATDSNVKVANNNLINAVLPDDSKLTFIKSNDATYKNELNGYTLSVVDDGYIIRIDDTNYHFDIDGRLSAISNKYDDVITITRTASSITISDEANRAYTLAIDAKGKIISIIDPANNIIEYTYDDNANLTKVVDQAGVTIGQYSYTNDVLTKSMDKTIKYGDDGRKISYEYDSGAYLNLTYDDENKTISTESSVETTTSQTYNDACMTVSSTDEDSNTTEYTYDEYYRILTETAGGSTVTYTYDENGNTTSEISDNEDTENTYYTYDNNGNLICRHTGDDCSYYVYDDNNDVILTAVLKDGYTGEIPPSYDSSLTCFDTVSYNYDNGMLTKTVDGKVNETVTYIYDEYGNTIKTSTITVKDNETSVGTVDCTYDIMGDIHTSISGEDSSSYIYDEAGRTLLANVNGECTRNVYDNLGRVIQEISPEDYDSVKEGLPAENTYADTNAGHTYKYAANGTLTSETNRLGKTTKYFYNDIGSKIREEFDIYKFYYLNHGELYQVKIANTTTVSYFYSTDGKFLLMQETYANDDSIRYTYNDNYDVTAQYHNSNAKPYVTYTYNEDNELTEKINTDTGLKYVYGENNRVDVYRTLDNTLVQSYVGVETEANEETATEGFTTVTENHFGTVYSSIVKNKSVSYSVGTDTIEYSYKTTGTDDEKIASDEVKNGNASVISSAYTYDDNANITKKALSYGNSTIDVVNSYDDKGRIVATGYGEISEYFTYDNDSQIIRVDNNIAENVYYTSTYTYDSRGNVTSKNVYNYTRNKDITTSPKETTTFTYANSGWVDQLVAVNGVELTYDENGNVLTYGDKEYFWNTGRQLESVTDGENEYSYTYDENGIRTSKTIDGVTTYYNTQDGVILSQTDGTNTMYFQYDSNGLPLGFIYNNATQYFYLTNPMGDVISITDNQGNELVQYEYDEWGKLLSITADSDENYAIAEMNPLRYRGYYYDNETGYYYLQSRYYDPSICRFINSDVPEIANMSKDIPVGTNLFAYCNNNPVNNSDPNGAISIKSAFNTILNAIKQRISDYFKQLFSVKNGKVKIAVSLFAIFINGIISALISGAVYKGITSLLKLTVNHASKKVPQKLITAIETVVKLMETSGFFKIVGNMLIKRALKLPSAIGTFAGDLKNYVLYSGLLNRYKILNKISLVVSMFSSIGGFIATIIDVMDGNWDGYLIFKVSNKKVILL